MNIKNIDVFNDVLINWSTLKYIVMKLWVWWNIFIKGDGSSLFDKTHNPRL